MFTKIIHGFVVQTFNDEGRCTEQAFIAGDSDYEDSSGDELDNVPEHAYQTMNMEQP